MAPDAGIRLLVGKFDTFQAAQSRLIGGADRPPGVETPRQRRLNAHPTRADTAAAEEDVRYLKPFAAACSAGREAIGQRESA